MIRSTLFLVVTNVVVAVDVTECVEVLFLHLVVVNKEVNVLESVDVSVVLGKLFIFVLVVVRRDVTDTFFTLTFVVVMTSVVVDS